MVTGDSADSGGLIITVLGIIVTMLTAVMGWLWKALAGKADKETVEDSHRMLDSRIAQAEEHIEKLRDEAREDRKEILHHVDESRREVLSQINELGSRIDRKFGSWGD